MGKRFGRNQKRKAREEIASLREALQRDGALLAYVTKQNRELEAAIDNARSILPAYCVALPPLLKHMPDTSRHGARNFRMPVMGRVCFESTRQEKIAQLNIMLQHVDISSISGAMHIRLHYRDDVLAYAATEEAIHSIPAQELARIVAYNVSEAVVRKLKG